MPREAFPWPSGPLTAPYYRNRHLFTGDSTPPTLPAGPASASTRVPYLETGSGGTSGLYDAESRAIGLNEPAVSSKINRALYSLQCGQDALFEKDLATLTATSAALIVVGPPYELDLLTWIPGPVLVYLGPGTTISALAGDSRYWCSNYVKLWTDGGLQPLLSAVTGVPYSVDDIVSEAAGIGTSLYAALPNDAQAFPVGTTGTLDVVAGVTLTFVGGVDPSGVPGGGVVCFFNYSHYERQIASFGDPADAYAISLSVGAGVYTTNRNLAAAGWLHGDIIYTSHVAYAPTLILNDALTANATLLHGSVTPFGLALENPIMDMLRFAGAGQTFGLPFTMTEPASATQRSFDYANALFRANDGVLRGTVGFDVRGDADDGIGDRDVFAGFLHRKSIAFAAGAAGTVFAVGNSCSYDSGTLTVTLGAGGHVWGAGGATDTHLIVGVDCIELYDGTGANVGLYVVDALTGATTFTIRDLDGAVSAYGVDIGAAGAGGTCTLFRTAFRSGGLYTAASLIVSGNVLVGDNYGGGVDTAPLTLYSGGADDIITAYDWPKSGRDVGVGGTPNGPTFRVTAAGMLVFGADQDDVGTAAWEFTPAAAVVAGPTTKYSLDMNPLRTWATNGDPHLYSASYSNPGGLGAPGELASMDFRVGPNGTEGLDEGGTHPQYLARLFLGDPGDDLTTGVSQTFAAFVAGPGAALRLRAGIIAHRFGETYEDLYAWLYQGDATPLPPIPEDYDGYPGTDIAAAYHRFELTFDATGDDEHRINYAWSEPRIFWHEVNAQNGIVLPGASAKPWAYGELGFPFPLWGCDIGDATPSYVDFPINVPDGCTITNVVVRYYCDNIFEGAGHRHPTVEVQRLYVNYGHSGGGAPSTAPLGAVSPMTIDGAPALGYTTTDYVCTLVNVVQNSGYQYYVRIRNGYDVDVPLVAIQGIIGIRVQYTMQDFLPA